ncbi:hypothetical protein HYQ44_020207 [Verticillium longisporum]|nr:hypothetical protein HYQ44_020207 [Verticillium longisporum]
MNGQPQQQQQQHRATELKREQEAVPAYGHESLVASPEDQASPDGPAKKKQKPDTIVVIGQD